MIDCPAGPEHGGLTSPDAPGSADTVAGKPNKLRVFMSYGHDRFEELAVRLDNDLRARGHDVWFDKRIQTGSDWEWAIEKGLEWASQGRGSGWVVLLMTPHTVRRPAGYCLNELERAIEKQIPIAPVMVVTVEPPLSICRLQYLDMTDCVPLPQKPANYARKFDALCSALETQSLTVEGESNRLRRALKPAPDDIGTTYALPRFTGRRRVVQAFDDWLADPDGPPVFRITGPLGSGKSAIAAWLSANRAAIKAFHNCGLDRKNADPRQAVCSIAWQLSTQLPQYFERLAAIDDIETLCRDEAADTLFNRLIIQPGHGLAARDKPVVVLIDSLDEATQAGANGLADLLGVELARLPPGLRFLLFSGPEVEVTVPLQAWKSLELAFDSSDNISDVGEYVRKHIARFSPGGTLAPPVLERLLEASRCNWLYLDWVRRGLEQGCLTLETVDRFPPGLGGAFHHEFRRRFPDCAAYNRRYRRCLTLVAAAREPLRIADIARVLDQPEAEARDAVREFGALLSVCRGFVVPFHHALLRWVTDESGSGRYGVCPADGHRDLARDGWDQFERGPDSMSGYARRHLPAHLREAGEEEKLERCVTDAGFLGAAFKEDKLYDLARFWKDLDRSRITRRCAESFAAFFAQARGKAGVYEAALGTGRLCQQAGMYAPAISYFRKALLISRKLRDENGIGHALLSLSWCLRHRDRFDEALKHAGEAIRHFEKAGNCEGVARALSVQGMCCWHRHDDAEALRHLEDAVALYGKAGDDRSRAEALNHLGIVRRSLCLFDEALESLHQSEQLSLKHRDKKALGKCLNSLGTAYWWKGEREQAIDCYRRADELNEEMNQPYVAGLTANNLGYIYLETGQPRMAYDSFCRAREIRRALGIESYEMMDLSGMALACARMDRIEEARSLSRQAVGALRKYKTVEDLRRAYYNHYLIMKDGSARDRAEAARALRKARTIVGARIRKIKDEKILARFLASVPLAEELGLSGLKAAKSAIPRRASRRASTRSPAGRNG